VRHILLAANLLLLVAFPVAWAAPLLTAGLLPWFGRSEISVLSGIGTLWDSDPALASLVAALALVVPYGKTLAMVALQAGWLTERARPLIKALARLAMADVFLIALYIVAAKGVGVGRIETEWGLWLFTGCVLASLALSSVGPARR